MPVYGECRKGGSYRLLDGYCTTLNGLIEVVIITPDDLGDDLVVVAMETIERQRSA